MDVLDLYFRTISGDRKFEGVLVEVQVAIDDLF
jgi:hypothetical protein